MFMPHPGRAPSRASLCLLLFIALAACSASRRTITELAPTTPRDRCDGETEGAARCDGDVPQTCRTLDGVHRWWPTTPLDSQGRPARCAGVCVVARDGNRDRATCSSRGL